MGSFRLKVGNAEVVALSDMSFPFPRTMEELWPGVPVKAWEPYIKRYPDTFEGPRMRIEIGCYLVRSLGRTILIDTGYGPGPIDYIGGLRGQLMADLTAQKVRPAEVDVVFMSHLHLDHVGWNTREERGKLVPTFPNARYVVHQADLDYFRRPEVQAVQSYPYMEQYVESLITMSRMDILSGDKDLTREVRAVFTPGHTPGHMSVLVSSQDQRAFIEGDVLIHPAQVTEDGWNCRYDLDFDMATRTRRKLLDQLEADGTTVIACHFPAPGFGRVVRLQGKRYWRVGV